MATASAVPVAILRDGRPRGRPPQDEDFQFLHTLESGTCSNHQTSPMEATPCGRSPAAGRLDEITSVLVAIQRKTGSQGFKLPHDLAAVAASNRGHELFEIFRSIGKRGLDRGETPPFQPRPPWPARFPPI